MKYKKTRLSCMLKIFELKIENCKNRNLKNLSKKKNSQSMHHDFIR